MRIFVGYFVVCVFLSFSSTAQDQEKAVPLSKFMSGVRDAYVVTTKGSEKHHTLMEQTLITFLQGLGLEIKQGDITEFPGKKHETVCDVALVIPSWLVEKNYYRNIHSDHASVLNTTSGSQAG